MAIAKRTWKIIALMLVAAIACGAFIAYKMYTKPHTDVAKSESLSVAAGKLVSDFEADEAKANGAYLNKVLDVEGVVAEITTNQEGKKVVSLTGSDMGNVMCSFEENPSNLPAVGSGAKLKGICTGYLTDVVLVRCIISN